MVMLCQPLTGAATNWWLRSPNTGNTNNFWNVNSNGNVNNNNNANNAYGVAFGSSQSRHSNRKRRNQT